MLATDSAIGENAFTDPLELDGVTAPCICMGTGVLDSSFATPDKRALGFPRLYSELN